MITKTRFTDSIRNLPTHIPSKTGKAFYNNFQLTDTILQFQRVNTNKTWDLDIEAQWSIYSTQSFINTTVVKNLMEKRVNSPSIAILMAIGCIDSAGNRL